MVLIALIIGAVLIVAALRGTQGDLATALKDDVPAYVIWAAAIIAIGALGYVPGIKPVSRALLGLVLVVIVLKNYSAVLAGFQNAWQNPPAAGSGGGSDWQGSSGSISAGDVAQAASAVPNFLGAY